MDNVSFTREYKVIPTRLTEKQFNEFVLPHLSKGKRGPATKLSFYHIFCYILLLIYTGMQWQSLPIKTDHHGTIIAVYIARTGVGLMMVLCNAPLKRRYNN
jgi:hypothetical protein